MAACLTHGDAAMPRLKPLAALGLLALFGYQYSFAEEDRKSVV